jgi:CHAT domain-containing protein/predicted negative regulator of RcsB-dependent stress response
MVCLVLALLVVSLGAQTPSVQRFRGSSPRDPHLCAEASGLVDSARLLQSNAEFNSSQEALARYGQALKCWQSINAHRQAADTLRSIGEIYQETGQYQFARDAHQQALAESERIRDVRGQVLSLIAIGLVEIDLDQIDHSLAHTNEAFSLAKNLDDDQIQTQVMSNYTLAYVSRGDLAEAAKYADQAIGRLGRLKDDADIQGRAFLFAGYVKNDSGNLKDALDYYQRALAFFQKYGQAAWQSRALTAIGGLYVSMGEPQQALNYDEGALDIQKRLGNRRMQAVTFNNIGYAYREVGDFEHALDNYSNALGCYRELGHERGQAQTSVFVGSMHRLLGDFQRARESYEFSQTLSQKLNDKVLRALSLTNLGLLNAAEGDFREAIDNYSQALATYQRIGDVRGQVITANALGDALVLTGKKESASRHLLHALYLVEKTGDRELEVSTRYNLAQVHRSLGHLNEARTQIETSLEVIESLRLKLARFELRSSYFATVRQFYEFDADILMQLHRQNPTAGLDAMAFAVSERARARSLLESLKESEVNTRADAETALLEEERMVQQQLNDTSVRRARLLVNPGSPELDAVIKEIDQLTMRYQDLEARIRSQSSRFAAVPPPQPLGLQESQRLLDPNSMLLEYMLGDQRSYLWVITSAESYSFELPPRSQIESLASDFRGFLVADQPIAGESYEQTQTRIADAAKHLLSHSIELGKVLLGPVAEKLGNKRLLIVPDGRLQSIPFQALTTPDARGLPRQLVETHEIIYEPSASALAMVEQANAQRKVGAGSVAVFANPVFEVNDPRVGSATASPGSQLKLPQLMKEALRDMSIQGGRIPALPASREEADAIMSLVPWRSGLKIVDFQASRLTIGQANLSQYRIVHFATHGFVDYQHPELSGLVLSMVDEKGNPQDGFLRMHDIYNLKLPVDLVVLSACNTGLGKEVKGEGLIGLTRGFMYAGARGVVASLWKVDDDATAELMKHFYAGMFQRNLTPGSALRDAQLALRSQKRWQSPYYWAAFVIQGEYDQKPFAGTSRGLYAVVIAGAGVFVLTIGAFLFRWKRKPQIQVTKSVAQ